jgi:hypothetical protein
MPGHQLLALGMALACLLIAGLLWQTVGHGQLPAFSLPHLPAKPATVVASAPAPATGVASGAFSVGAQRNLAGAINESNNRAAAALDASR